MSRDSRSPGLDLYVGPPKHESRLLVTLPLLSVTVFDICLRLSVLSCEDNLL